MITKLAPKGVKKSNKQFKQERNIVIVGENITYAKNVANIFRIADALHVRKVLLLGESHTPPFGKDLKKVSRNKEMKVDWEHPESFEDAMSDLKKQGYTIIAIEQCEESVVYTEQKYPEKVAFVIGSEMFGLSKKILALCDAAVIIPMYGKGGSVNVHVALGIVAFYASLAPIQR